MLAVPMPIVPAERPTPGTLSHDWKRPRSHTTAVCCSQTTRLTHKWVIESGCKLYVLSTAVCGYVEIDMHVVQAVSTRCTTRPRTMLQQDVQPVLLLLLLCNATKIAAVCAKAYCIASADFGCLPHVVTVRLRMTCAMCNTAAAAFRSDTALCIYTGDATTVMQ